MHSQIRNEMGTRSAAFTLIEILVVVAILLILFGGAIAGFSGFGQRQKVKQGGENVKNLLRTVQGKAYTGETTCPTLGYSFVGWEVNLTGRTYRQICVNTSGTPIPQSAIPVSISPPVTISVSNAPILFRNFPKRAEMSVVSFPICVGDGSGSFYKIIVDQSGSISDSGNFVSVCP